MNTSDSFSSTDSATTRAADEASRHGAKLEKALTEQAHALQTGVDSLLTQAPAAITGLVHDAEVLLRSGFERLHQAGDRTSVYVKDEPVKAMLIAAAAGALAAVALGWVTRSRHGS